MSNTRLFSQSTTTDPVAKYLVLTDASADYKILHSVYTSSVLGGRLIGTSVATAITTNNGSQTLSNKVMTSPNITNPVVTGGSYTQGSFDRPTIDRVTETSGSHTNGSYTTPFVNGFQILTANGGLIDQCSGLGENIQAALNTRLMPYGTETNYHTVIPYYTASFTGVTSKNFTSTQILTELGFSPTTYFVCADEGVFVEAYVRSGTAGAYVYDKDTTVGVKLYTTTSVALYGDDLAITTCSVTGLSSPSTYRVSLLVSIEQKG